MKSHRQRRIKGVIVSDALGGPVGIEEEFVKKNCLGRFTLKKHVSYWGCFQGLEFMFFLLWNSGCFQGLKFLWFLFCLVFFSCGIQAAFADWNLQVFSPVVNCCTFQLAKTQGNVFATDAILATIMCCSRSSYSWDIVVQRVGNKLFFDKRDDSDFDLLTVSETATEPPQDEGNSINSPRNLALEATFINHNFSQQVLKSVSATTVSLSKSANHSGLSQLSSSSNKSVCCSFLSQCSSWLMSEDAGCSHKIHVHWGQRALLFQSYLYSYSFG